MTSAGADFLILRGLIVLTAVIFAVVNGFAVIRRRKVTDRAYPAAQVFPLLYIAFVIARPGPARAFGGADTEAAILMILITGLAERITNND